MSSDIVIQVKNLSKKYTLKHPVKDVDGNVTYEHWALNEVSFEIKKGEAVGIIGPNGSGKSTLLKILSGITKPTSGSVEIRGRVASILDIGAGFHQELSGRENIYLNGQILGFKRKEIKQQFEKIVAFSGIGNFINEPVKNYSNGMYLRLAFSILVHLDFDIYLFDEVMSVGDAEFQLKSHKKIEELIQFGKSIILVSHNSKELEKFSRQIFLEKGGLVPTEEINLTHYLEKSMISQNNINIETKNCKIEEFKPSHPIDLVELKQVILKQNEDKNAPFFTDLPLILEIEYIKKKSNQTLDLLISISNLNGDILFSSSPFIGGSFNQKTEAENPRIQCEFPSNFFNSQIYSLHIWFFKNLDQSLSNQNHSFTSKTFLNEKKIDVSNAYKNVIQFKPTFRKNGLVIDLSSLNIYGALLPQLKWTEI
ncbi:MAG: ABC transporter ATP-binding protein [Bacteroidia bacterium]|nr:ABC transporter ATP-binding protein [Bacteroidia bacterium]MCF8427068.1 ABC transporter ATP-binding protein [Bacteroidia bacterium]MCF8446890.1 ABC transporter ATP-binding protein [Bacteroidia bacterium]